jgi:molybdenum ABC transporter molybdate-binding protein
LKKLLCFMTSLCIAGSLTGCSSNQDKEHIQTITAFVAANATDPFNSLAKQFENSHHDVKIETNFAGTQILETQLEQGAQADLFLSADLSHIQRLKQEGLIKDFFPVSKTHLVIVVPKNNPAGIQTLQDLGTKPVKLVIGTDSVPVGMYSREMLEKANAGYGKQFSKNVISHVVSMETNVKQVLQKISMGEADAGIVYRTDVTPNLEDKVSIIEIPESYNMVATNYIAVPKNAPSATLGEEFMKFMLSPQGQMVFKNYGYDSLRTN